MDDDLARRLARLRHSLDSGNNPPFIDKGDNLPPDNDEDVLVTRFRKLFEKSPAYEGKLHSEEFMDDIYCKPGQHISVKELTNTLSLEKETWAVDEIDDNQLEHLLSDIRTSTSIQEVEGRSRTVATLVPNWLQNNSLKEHAKSDADAEENILKMIKDEIERFEALGGPELPSVPTTAPPPKPLYSRDLVDETDTWCCICNEDGEYRCLGCENDIYCASCLYEAHTRPDAGSEERKHKWTRYTKPKELAQC